MTGTALSPPLPLSYKSIKYSFKIKYKEQKRPDVGGHLFSTGESIYTSLSDLPGRSRGPFPAPQGLALSQGRERKAEARPQALEAKNGWHAHRVQKGTGKGREYTTNYRDLQCPGLGPTRALKQQRLSCGVNGGLRSRRGAKEKSANPFTRSRSGGRGRRQKAGGAASMLSPRSPPRRRAQSAGPKPSSAPPPGRRPPAVRRAFPARRAPGPRLPCRPVSPVQASERPRTPVRPRAASPTRAPCLMACNAAELGPRPGKGSARPSCPSLHSP